MSVQSTYYSRVLNTLRSATSCLVLELYIVEKALSLTDTM